ncbi:MAG: flagellar biosynthesis protein FlhF [Acidobacteriota bacterium]
MMNLKKYRATTTRDALELVKQDLGEDAFVVETKQVRTRGFLGLRSSTQIEVSAALSPVSEKIASKKAAKKGFPAHGILNLRDDSPALPSSTDPKRDSLMAALNARADSSDQFEKAIIDEFARPRIQSVEVSSLAPRIVHPRQAVVAAEINSDTTLDPQVAGVNPIAGNVNSREIELLRAEMRDVKFSLDAFAKQQRSTNPAKTDFELPEFSEIADPPFYDVFLQLTGKGVSGEIASQFVSEIIQPYKAEPMLRERLLNETLLRGISSRLCFQPDVLAQDGPSIVAVVGATGVGKTTTIAKLAARVALYEHRRVELVTLDTYRIAAVEQLKTYAEIIGAGCHVVRSVFELDAIIRRLPSDATILVDTTGRSPFDLVDQFELSDYLRQRPEIRKCLVIQATINSIDSSAAIKKFGVYGVDCVAVTKLDETLRPGSVIDAITENGLPLAYLCTGQRVPEDLQVATADSLTERILTL